MAEFVDTVGKVHLNRPIRRVLHSGERVTGVELADGTRKEFDHVVSTMPLTLLIQGLENVPVAVSRAAGALKFRNTILVYLHLAADNLFPDQWVYVHEPNLQVGRITNFRNWAKELYGPSNNTIVAMEYWCNDADDAWREPDERMVERAKHEMRGTGLLGRAEILDGTVVRVPKCYPVYARGYKTHLEVVVNFLRNFKGLTPIGRYGAFKYNNQDHSILMGLLASEQILAQNNYDHWSVNTDYDCYQEQATITQSGLVTAS
jgi:protoporphyrinogen oxidase